MDADNNQSIKEKVEFGLRELKEKVGMWAEAREEEKKAEEWKREFGERREEIEKEMRDKAEEQAERLGESWDDFRLRIKDELDKLQNRAEEAWGKLAR